MPRKLPAGTDKNGQAPSAQPRAGPDLGSIRSAPHEQPGERRAGPASAVVTTYRIGRRTTGSGNRRGEGPDGKQPGVRRERGGRRATDRNRGEVTPHTPRPAPHTTVATGPGKSLCDGPVNPHVRGIPRPDIGHADLVGNTRGENPTWGRVKRDREIRRLGRNGDDRPGPRLEREVPTDELVLERVAPAGSRVLDPEVEEHRPRRATGHIPDGPTETTADDAAGGRVPAAAHQVDEVDHRRFKRPKLSVDGRDRGTVRIEQFKSDRELLTGRQLGGTNMNRGGFGRCRVSHGRRHDKHEPNPHTDREPTS